MPTTDRPPEPRIRARFTMLPAKGPIEPHEECGKVGVGVVVPATIVILGDTGEIAPARIAPAKPSERHDEIAVPG